MPRPKRIAIACGGTGGHLFPGIAVAEVLLEKDYEPILFVSQKPIDYEISAERTEFIYEFLPAIGMPPVFSPRFLSFLFKLWQAIGLSRKAIRRYRADLVLGMGGFTSLPPLHAAKSLELPSLIHESNVIPGRANRWSAKVATQVLLGFEQARDFFPKATVKVVGTPLRSHFQDRPSREQVRQELGLDLTKPVLAVLGGSQGAQGVNEAIGRSYERLASADIQLIHLTGTRNFEAMEEQAMKSSVRGRIAPFSHEMPSILAAADLVVSRSGASSLTEIAAFSLPSLLIPYPHAADDHQRANARVFEEAGAALMVEEADLRGDQLGHLVIGLLQDAPKRQAMVRATAAIARPQATEAVVQAVEALLA
ncbi:MAG: undecaprenyldiphospho-muramoylpentapeptide beta-N-acetylglucosaminyltransferase [Verrucomicrobiota bacterium]